MLKEYAGLIQNNRICLLLAVKAIAFHMGTFKENGVMVKFAMGNFYKGDFLDRFLSWVTRYGYDD